MNNTPEGIKEHNMTLREKFQKEFPLDSFDFSESSDKVYDWFLARFDAMLAEDIGKIVYGVRPRMEAYEIEIIATKVLEDRRLSLKK